MSRLAIVAIAAATILLAIVLGYAFSGREDNGPVVLAASSLQESLEEVADAWAAQGHPRPVLSFGGTAMLARQAEAGAPADLFISADEAWMDELAGERLIRDDSRASFLTNRLVLIAPSDSEVRLEARAGMKLATALDGGRLAMADPEAVPAGRYGRQALSGLGVWAGVSDRIASTDSVRQALALVAQGEAPLGIVFATDALGERGVRVVTTFPEASHMRITYPVAMLAKSRHPDAEAFRRFLLSPEAKQIFREHGFGAP